MGIFDWIRTRQRRAKAARELRNLSPELLWDIGIEPGRETEAVDAMLARQARAKPEPDMLLYKAALFQPVTLRSAQHPGR